MTIIVINVGSIAMELKEKLIIIVLLATILDMDGKQLLIVLVGLPLNK
jgi:hypothetical protein